jgi:hypothetical protein
LNAESAPKGAQESATTGPIVCAGGLSLDDRLAAFEAGRQQGKAERIEIEIEDQVQARIHDRVRESLGLARLSARHGAAFSAMVTESGQRE